MNHRTTTWIRVNRQTPCQICQKPDWCLVAANGSTAICARIESDRPAGNKGAGWVHRLQDVDWQPLPARTSSKSAEHLGQRGPIDWERRNKKYVRQMTEACSDYLAVEIGVKKSTIETMNVGWCTSRGVWTWPMRNADGAVVGIRTRATNGDKRSDSGSDGNGLFLGPDLASDYLLICEGPTDCATLIDCGFLSTVGRPSCRGGTEFLVTIIQRLQPHALLLIPDRDNAGLTGFADLASEIVNRRVVPLIRIDAVVPPEKDARAWAKKNRDDLTGTIAKKIKSIKARSGELCHEGERL